MYDYKISRTGDKKEKEALRSFKKDNGILCSGICTDGNYHLPGIYAGRLCLAGLYFIYGTFCQRDYEYTLENDTLTIDVIYGNKYRKTAHELDLRELEMIAPHWHQAVAKYKKERRNRASEEI